MHKLLNWATFGYFFKDTVDVKITAADQMSGIAFEHRKPEKVDVLEFDKMCVTLKNKTKGKGIFL